MLKLIDHHALENIALVVDVVEDILPEDVEDLGSDEKAANTHPKSICESSERERYDEVWEDG